MSRVTVQMAPGVVERAEVMVTSLAGVTVRVPARVVDEVLGILEFESPFQGEIKARPIVHYADGSTLREVKE